MRYITKLYDMFKRFNKWALRSKAIWFNTIAGLLAIFGENIAVLAGVSSARVYATLSICVPMVNYLLRMYAEKKKVPNADKKLD